jgi:hypothetical protein
MNLCILPSPECKDVMVGWTIQPNIGIILFVSIFLVFLFRKQILSFLRYIIRRRLN